MKELKLLDEDWKGEIDYWNADVRTWVDIDGSERMETMGQSYPAIEGSTYYEVANGKCVELTPEPRPADSIKLSKCDGRHIIVGLRNNDTCKAVYSGNEWHLSSGVGNVIDHRDDLGFLLFNMAVTNIKIYDISK